MCAVPSRPAGGPITEAMPIGGPAGAGDREHPHGPPSLDVVVLGTSARWPTPDRAVSAAMVMRGADHVLIDCGEGTQLQMMRSVAGLRRLSTILITHCHADHVLGLPGLLATLSDARTEPLVLLGPPGVRDLIDGFRVHFGELAFPLAVREVDPGHVERRDGYRLLALETSHGVPSLAWALDEDPLPGHLLEGRLDALGVPPGPARADLARGVDVDLEDGRRVAIAQVTGPARPGRRIVVSGDTRPAPAVAQAAAGANLLVHEATFLTRDRVLADRAGHSTAADAARLAVRAQVGLLALVHRSTRYDRGEVLEEARAIFGATVVPEDLDLIQVPLSEHGPPVLRPQGGRVPR